MRPNKAEAAVYARKKIKRHTVMHGIIDTDALLILTDRINVYQ